jgi:type IV secretion system protein TrbC
MGRTDATTRLALPGLLVLASVALLPPEVAHAATGGGALPWDAPLTTLKNDLTGPVAFTIALLAMVAAGAALAFGGEMSQFTRAMIMVVLVAAFITGVVNVAAALGITGAVV